MPNADNTGPGYPEGYKLASTGYEYDALINLRVWTGFPKWGFVIFRGTYDNDAEWATFIALLKESVAESLQFAKQEENLRPDFEWTIIEDRASLDNVSTDVVRARFLDWVAARSVERDGVQADVPWMTDRVPRYRYCIYINDACFSSMGARKVGRTTQWTLDGGEVAIINSMHCPCDDEDDDETDEDEDDSEEGEKDEGYPPIEGNTDYDVGWAYVQVIGLGNLYSSMCYANEWEMVYRGQRPDRRPEARQGQPLSVVDRVWVAGSSLAPEY
ncbi:hypothetical protein B0T11DRAFT_102423 [Plectosphaerella cucumerina]|uniref:Uncharacterized protein n=1 Tax=Plectosphaerella cucumerina TaxID=40658 RepID=A0A8K0TAJ2_9PEZI|nr:hypothetical protein B0T11DRAFT_102423 [Plectosphaerella cucumerina]